MGFKDAIDRIVKIIPVFLLIALGLIFRCELFHQTINNELFAEYPSMSCKVDRNQYEDFLRDINRTDTQGHTSCFIVVQQRKSRLENTVSIYTNSDNVKLQLLKKGFQNASMSPCLVDLWK